MDNVSLKKDSSGKWTPSKKRWLVLILCSLLFILSQFYRVSSAIIAPLLQKELDISSEALGMLGATFFYAFAIAQIPLGLFLDRIGARLIMTVLTLVGAIGSFIFASAHDMTIAILGRTLLGLGMAGNLMGTLKLFTRWFSPREFATLSGVILALGTLGNMIAATPLALMVNTFGWRWSFVLIGIVTFLFAVTFFFLVHDDPKGASLSEPDKQPSSSTGRKLRLLFSSRDYWIICFGTFIRYGIFVAIQGLWAGPYLIEGLGYSMVEAGNLLLLLNIGYLGGAPLGGWLSDRAFHSPKRVVLLGMALSALCIFALSGNWSAGSTWMLGGILIILGISSSFGIIMYPHIKDLMPPDMSGMALTGINLYTMLGGAIVTQVMGVLLDHLSESGMPSLGDYQSIFFIASLSVACGWILYIFTKKEAAP
jgi:sugar phosphate permease